MIRLFYILIAVFSLLGCDSSNQQRESVSDSDFRQAVRDGNVDLVITYLDVGYDINRLGMGGENALQEGVLHYDVVKLLIDRGVRVNQQHKHDGTTPLIVASIAGNVEARTIKLLLDEGADTSITDTHGKTALDYALQYGRDHPEDYHAKIDLLKAATKEEYPTAKPVDGKQGFVISPHSNKIVDVRDLESGTLVQDPNYPSSKKKFFHVP